MVFLVCGLRLDAHSRPVGLEFDAKEESALDALLLAAETDGATHTDRVPYSMLVVWV